MTVPETGEPEIDSRSTTTKMKFPSGWLVFKSPWLNFYWTSVFEPNLYEAFAVRAFFAEKEKWMAFKCSNKSSLLRN